MKTSKNLTWFIVITQAILMTWSIASSILAAGPASAAIISYVLFGAYVIHALVFRHPTMIKLVIFGILAGLLELITDHYLVETINNLVYPGNEAMIWSSPAYMPFAWANVLIQLGYYGILLSKWKGWPIASVALGLAGAMYIPLYEHLAKDAGWWWYHANVPMIFNAPNYVIICEGLISLSLPFLLTRSSKNSIASGIQYGVLAGIWIYLSALLAYWLGG
ncbi:DUF6989 domain-containing protein [Marinoscillum furvescens]|uniref:DUF6989 domain-containing protein n=1 Tax=Marinoscillum furvescens DSM 4134 TaxID=1122208 RepID=A0A3D9L4V3_MARFU|nr:hypothetical protein [Marinoscillum furvescens]RED99825.1 hypothetical protein C7460_107107 [Marinoscillum furvescens DSM 4134]